MKKLRCKLCNATWYIEEEMFDKQNVCPCCAKELREKVDIVEFDSLDKAIYGVITKAGINILQNPRQLLGYLLDIAPELKKEIRIFSKAYNEEYLMYVRDVFEKEISEAELVLYKLRHIFIEEEGLSENWADMLCAGIWGAVKYTKGIGISTITFAEIEEIEFVSKEGNKKEISEKIKSGYESVASDTDISLKRDTYIDNSISKRRYGDDAKKTYELAISYYLGKGRSKDEKEALKLLRKVANYDNYIPAYNYLGDIYCKKRIFEKAIQWYRKSAAVEDIDGLVMLGYIYQKGYGTSKHSSKGEEYYIKAVKRASEDNDGYRRLIDRALSIQSGIDYPKDEVVAATILEKVAESGSADALYQLGICYMDGKGKAEDNKMAIKYFKKAADQNHLEAKNMLQRCLKDIPWIERIGMEILNYDYV